MSPPAGPLLPPAGREPDGPRLCMVLLTGMGDVVHGLPVANALKDHRPDLRIVWVAEPAPSGILAGHPSVDRIVVFRPGRGLRGVFELWRDLRPVPCDTCLNLQRYFKSAFPTLLSRAPRRIGLAPSRTRDGIRFLHTHHLPEGPWRHTQDLFLEFLDALQVPRPHPLEWRIAISQEERRAQRAFFDPLEGRPVVGVVLATANPRKDWPAERYVPLVEALEGELGLTVVLVGGPTEAERSAAELVLERARTRPRVGLGDSVRRLIWQIDGCAVVVSPDTGPLHVAHALDVPVVGLFGHTNPWRVGPYSRFHDLVVDRYTDPEEDPDPSRYDPRHGRMEQITVEDVLERVERARVVYGAGRPRTSPGQPRRSGGAAPPPEGGPR